MFVIFLGEIRGIISEQVFDPIFMGRDLLIVGDWII